MQWSSSFFVLWQSGYLPVVSAINSVISRHLVLLSEWENASEHKRTELLSSLSSLVSRKRWDGKNSTTQLVIKYAFKYFSQLSDGTIYLMHLKLFKYRDAHELRLDRNNWSSLITVNEEKTTLKQKQQMVKEENANSKLLETLRGS